MTRHVCRCLGVAALLAAVAACGSARRSTPVTGPPSFSPAAQRGQVVFMQNCNQCHPQGEAGLGPAINDKPFPEFLKEFQVRHGLGAMPSFSEKEVSDQQLEDLMTYLEELKERNRRR